MSDDYSQQKPKLPSHIAFNVEEGKENDYWHRIGAAWPTKNGGFTQKLTTIPLDGKVVLIPREEVERMRAERQAASETPAAPTPEGPTHGPKP